MSVLNTIKSKKPEDGYYHVKPLLESFPDALYYIIYSGRTNGKTYSCLEYMLEQYFKHNEKGVIIRRYDEDYKNKRGYKMFKNLVQTGVVRKLSHNRYNDIQYRAGEYYLIHINEEGEIDEKSTEPFCFGLSLTAGEHDKSTGGFSISVKTVVFDEFIGRHYLDDEFVLLMQQISTVIRREKGTRIFLCGNTINPYNPYFEEMGLHHAYQQEIGTVETYEYGNSGLQVVVEYAEKPVDKYDSDVYFAFDNPKLKMITDGEWEIPMYPHCPIKIRPKDIKFRYFIHFKNDVLECEIVMVGKYNFTFIHQRTKNIEYVLNTDKELVFDLEENPLYNVGKRITTPVNGIQNKILWYFKANKVFYQDNRTGEVVRNYIEWSEQK